MIVTFLYRIRRDEKRYYGKYIGSIAPYEMGLDQALQEILFPLFQRLYDVKDGEVMIGILSVDREGRDYYSEEEKSVFDVLYYEGPLMPKEIFYQGNHLSENKKGV